MNLDGSNTIVFDIETLRSASDCRACNRPQDLHLPSGACGSGTEGMPAAPTYVPFGWNDHAALGLSIGCAWDYQDMRLHFFDRHTLAAWMGLVVNRQPRLVTFNGLGFDIPLLCAVLVAQHDPSKGDVESIEDLCRRFWAVAEQGYDLLAAIWAADLQRKFERGLNSMDAISQANGFGSKEMDGAMAPRLWAQGRIGEVINYVMSDVLKTKALLELVQQRGGLLRGDHRWLALPRPLLPQEPR